MAFRIFRNPKAIIHITLFLVLSLILACGSAAAPTSAPAPDVGAAKEQPTAAPAMKAQPTATPVAISKVGPSGVMAGTTPTATPQPTAVPVMASDNFGGYIPMADYAAPSKRPLWRAGSSTMKNMGPMFNTLVQWDPEDPDPSVIIGDLAESWEILDAGKTYIFHLNKKARWHDGVPVSAEDVVFSMDAMVCADCFEVLKGQRRSSTIFFKIAYDEGMSRVIDEKTVEIKLKFAVPAFLDMLSLSSIGIAPRHTVIDQGKVQHIYKSEDLNGSGPFMHLGYTPDVKNEFEKNADYWKEGLPRIDSMTHFIITDPGTLIAAFKSGQVLMQNQPTTPLNPIQAQKLDEDMGDELTVRWAGPSGMRGFQINTKKAPFNDIRVRRALHLAVHRQPVIDIISDGRHLLGTPLPPDTWYSYTSEEAAQMPGYRELNGEKHPDDLAEARRLLAEVGLPQGFKVELATRDAVGYPDIAAIIAAQLRRDLDWDITLKVYESAAGYAQYKVGNFQFNFQGSSYNFEDPDAALGRYALGGTASRRAAGGDIEGWVAPGFQEAFAAQAAEQDRDKRIELVLKAHDILLNEDNAYIGVFWSMRHWPINNRIQNINMHPSGYATHKLEHIWCDPKC